MSPKKIVKPKQEKVVTHIEFIQLTFRKRNSPPTIKVRSLCWEIVKVKQFSGRKCVMLFELDFVFNLTD